MKQLILILGIILLGSLSLLSAQRLTGTLYVGGTNANYQTLTAAINDLKAKGGNNVTLQLTGTFNESIKLNLYENNVTGLTIKGGTITSSDSQATVYLETGGAVTIENVTIKNTAYGSAIYFDNNMTFSTIKNCTLESYGGAVIRMMNDSHSNVIENNTIKGGDYGVYLSSSPWTTIHNRNYISGFLIAGIYTRSQEGDVDRAGHIINGHNQIVSSQNTAFNAYGIFINEGGNKITIEWNEIAVWNNNAPSYGIYVANYFANLDMKFNRIGGDFPAYILSSGTFTNNTFLTYYKSEAGVFIDGSSSSATSQFVNNEISSYYSDCITLNGGNFNVVNNSTFIYSTATSGSAFRINGGSVTLYNNSFYNSSTATNTQAIYINPSVTVNACDYNNLYSRSSRLGYKGSYASTISAWRTLTGYDRNSISADPQYMDPELGSTQIFLSSPLTGHALASVMPTDDRSGNNRLYNAIGANDPSTDGRLHEPGSGTGTKAEILIDAAGMVSVNYATECVEIAQIKISNLVNPDLVLSRTVEFTAGNGESVIDLSAYPKGYYVVNIAIAGKTVTKKFYKK